MQITRNEIKVMCENADNVTVKYGDGVLFIADSDENDFRVKTGLCRGFVRAPANPELNSYYVIVQVAGNGPGAMTYKKFVSRYDIVKVFEMPKTLSDFFDRHERGGYPTPPEQIDESEWLVN